MDRYIEQLIEDIRKATWKIKPPHELWIKSEADPSNELELEDISYLEKYMYGIEEEISDITGIGAELLPSAEKLTNEQKEILANELENLLHFFNFILDFPENYPAHLRYSHIRNFWNEKHVALSFGENIIDLCSCEKSKCPFPDYCESCEDLDAPFDFDDESGVYSNFDINTNDLLLSPEQMEEWYKNQKAFEAKENQEKQNSNNDSAQNFCDQIKRSYNTSDSGIYEDSAPVPGLCVICKKHQECDRDEQQFCVINRNEQLGNSDFKCDAFQNI